MCQEGQLSLAEDREGNAGRTVTLEILGSSFVLGTVGVCCWVVPTQYLIILEIPVMLGLPSMYTSYKHNKTNIVSVSSMSLVEARVFLFILTHHCGSWAICV